MTDRLDEIRQRAEAATPGPWEIGYDRGRNAIFIAHAREDIPYLLAEVERLRAALVLVGRA